MRHTGFCRTIVFSQVICWLLACAVANALLLSARSDSPKPELQLLGDPKVEIQRINPRYMLDPRTEDNSLINELYCSPQLLRSHSQARVALLPVAYTANHTFADSEFYRVRVDGTPTILYLEYMPSEPVNIESRNMVIRGAKHHLLQQRRRYGDDYTLRVEDDPYILTSPHPKKVVLRFGSFGLYQSDYKTAWNTITGISGFYGDDPGRLGSVACSVADRSISHKVDDVIVALSAIYS